MKTAVTVIEPKQISMDEWRDFRTTKVFDDDTTIGEIKDWIISTLKLKKERSEIGICENDISDVIS